MFGPSVASHHLASHHPASHHLAEDASDDDVFTTFVRLSNGVGHALHALAGWRLMEVLRDYGLPIRAECGGACACATCHVRITNSGRVPLRAPDDDELERLAEIFDADDSSRLACQILTGPQTDGLVVALADDSVLADARRIDFGGDPLPVESR